MLEGCRFIGLLSQLVAMLLTYQTSTKFLQEQMLGNSKKLPLQDNRGVILTGSLSGSTCKKILA